MALYVKGKASTTYAVLGLGYCAARNIVCFLARQEEGGIGDVLGHSRPT